MNNFMKYDHGTLASAYFENIRHTDADFRRRLYDLRIAMYKTTYEREYDWPKHTPKSNTQKLEPVFTVIPKPSEEQFKELYSPQIIHRKLSDNKGIQPPLDYTKSVDSKDDESKYGGKFAKTLYQESYINRMPVQVNKKEETLEEWVQRWQNECRNVRDDDDLVQALSDRIIKTQRIILNRKSIGDVY